jgi:GxxExxY protein
MNQEPLAKEGYELMAAAFEVYNELGAGFTEDIYQESLEDELSSRGIEHLAQPEIQIFYKKRPLRKRLRPDLLAFGDIIVELKAVKCLAEEHEAQILNYLKAARKPVGYLLNFGSHGKLEWKRFARTKNISVY